MQKTIVEYKGFLIVLEGVGPWRISGIEHWTFAILADAKDFVDNYIHDYIH